MLRLTKVCIAICMFAIIFSSCNKEPVASFEFDQNNVKAPATINFTNNSINASEYLWNFGDGNTSTETNPSHEYIKGGDFDVSLKAYGENSTNITVSTITILPNMTGHWNVTFVFGPNTMQGRMNLVELENHSLRGDFALSDDPEYTEILGTSMIDEYSVTIDAMLFSFYRIRFEGTVNSTYDSMGGDFYLNGTLAGAWSAKKL